MEHLLNCHSEIAALVSFLSNRFPFGRKGHINKLRST